MAQSKLDLFNKALGAVGAKGLLATINDNRKEAEVCKLYYSETWKLVAGAAYWPSLTHTNRLNLIKEVNPDIDWQNNQPMPGYKYVYRLPNALIRPRFFQDYSYFTIANYAGLLNSQDRMPELAIHTNTEEAVMTYTGAIGDPARWDTELYTLVAATLALEVGRALNVDAATYNRALDAWQTKYQMCITGQSNMNNTQPEETVPDWIAAREGGGITTSTRYMYPVQVLRYGPN